jgi:hypothetical protein
MAYVIDVLFKQVLVSRKNRRKWHIKNDIFGIHEDAVDLEKL